MVIVLQLSEYSYHNYRYMMVAMLPVMFMSIENRLLFVGVIQLLF